MAYTVSQGVSCSLGGSAVANVTQVAVNETCPTVETSDMSITNNGYKTYIRGLPDAADITINHIGSTLAIGNQAGGFSCGNISFSGATVMSSEVSYRVGEIVAYTTTVRASN
jgi:hypothetical protein